MPAGAPRSQATQTGTPGPARDSQEDFISKWQDCKALQWPHRAKCSL